MRQTADPLLLGLSAGDTQAFGLLYDRFAGRLFSAAMGLLGNRQDAEDVVQEVFTAMVRSREKLGRIEDLTAYIFSSLRHAAGRLAKRRTRRSAPSEIAEDAVVVEEQRDHPRGEELRRAISKLPADQREVIAMKIDGELTFAQISDVLGISQNTAASRYRYALEKLKTLLKEKE